MSINAKSIDYSDTEINVITKEEESQGFDSNNHIVLESSEKNK